MRRLASSVESRLKAIRFSGVTGRLHDGLCPLPTVLGLPLALTMLLLCAAALVPPCAATPFQWEYTGSLKTARFHHTATLLPDGRVLVAGGAAGVGGDRPLKSAELYNPATGTWSDAANLNNARDSNTATLLPSGMVLVAAGRQSGIYLTSAELYDPATDTWSLTGSLDTGRIFHTATLLPNGMVLVVGGIQGDIYLASAELYDPSAGTWSDTGSLITAREFHTATLLHNGKVLVAAGRGSGSVELTSAELYDPTTGTWSATGSLNTERYDHTATLLPNGMVLVAGGEPDELDSAELYDPATGTWLPTGNLNDGRADSVDVLLLNGMALVADGTSWDLSSAEIYDPATGTWSLTGSLNQARKDHAATLLLNGMVLVTGGAFAGGVPLASAELYDPGIAITLSAVGRKVGGVNTARLTWSGATSNNVDVNRDGVVIATAPNTGHYTDSTGTTGQASFTYKVCEAGTQTCSNEVTVRFRR
jgi:hypothetical protein